MQDKIINGKDFSLKLRNKITEEVSSLNEKLGKVPGLAVILVGDDPASQVYVANKGKQTVECGMESFEFKFNSDISEEELINKIEELNNDEKVNGILVQLPLPKHISENKVIQSIKREKDVDGFHIENRGLLVVGEDALVPCTPLGCLMLLEDRVGKQDLVGKNAVIIGRSNIVGKPMSQLLLNTGCTVTVCHSKTKDIKSICRNADILVAAVGKPKMINSDWVKEGAYIIDVGINRIKTDEGKNKLVGDVDFDDVFDRCEAITPVPGGVGPMTIACLLSNTLKAFKKQNNV
jgi:methylenetetrahydrofolate dehydrogenase (NADP+)/methenyltetrahydrofolate cyclohydrolase